MNNTAFIEDSFLHFYRIAIRNNFDFSAVDFSAVQSFHSIVSNNEQFTQNQAKFLIKILEKYQATCLTYGLDYSHEIKNPQWKKPFRTLDMTKAVWVERDEDNVPWVILKMPFSLKESMEKSVKPKNDYFKSSVWDKERQVRKLKIYNFNLVQINEFVEANNFQRDNSFLEILSEVEQIWQDQEQIVPCSKLRDGKVVLSNAPLEIADWWTENQPDTLEQKLFTAKTMGYPYVPEKVQISLIERLSMSMSNSFRLKELKKFFEIYKGLNYKVAVMVNKGHEARDWIKKFVEEAKNSNVDTSDIKVCFRLGKEEDHGFNRWIKDTGLGGTIETGKIFIFQNKPPKWLFTGEQDVKIIATNSVYPIPSSITQDWMNCHPCVIYLGDLKISQVKEKSVVEL